MERRDFMVAGLAGMVAWRARAAADRALVAVAANFARVAESLLPDFEAASGFRIVLSPGSTGQLYGQIINGAPYDAFLAADQVRPALLEAAGLSRGRQTYASGLLALWQRDGAVGADRLRGDFNYLAMANPALAPYGLAARQALAAMGLWEALQGRIVMGQNVGQAYALVASGNADLGLVARSYAQGQGVFWPVPGGLYDPILQDAVLLRESPAAAAFLAYLGSGAAQEKIRAAGYAPL